MECATLQWKWVDLEGGQLTFKNTKNGGDYTIPISPLMRTILRHREKEKINEFVFGYAASKTGRVVCPPQHAIKQVRQACGREWSMHDLRRTFTTALTGLGVHQFTIAHLMKHSPNTTMTLSYAPPTNEQLLEALTKFERHILKQVKK